MKEYYEKHRQYMFPCIANYYQEPIVMGKADVDTAMEILDKAFSVL